MRPLRLAVLGLLGSAVSLMPGPSAVAGERFPSWPSEVSRIAAPLDAGERPTQDAERAAALVQLEPYATEVIEPYVLVALSDPSNHVRREALRICYLRRMTSCMPAAVAIYGDMVEPTLKAAALRVIALEPEGKRLELVLRCLTRLQRPAPSPSRPTARLGPARGRST